MLQDLCGEHSQAECHRRHELERQAEWMLNRYVERKNNPNPFNSHAACPPKDPLPNAETTGKHPSQKPKPQFAAPDDGYFALNSSKLWKMTQPSRVRLWACRRIRLDRPDLSITRKPGRGSPCIYRAGPFVIPAHGTYGDN